MSFLEVDDIHTYYGQSHVLQGVSMDIEEGQVVSLLGRNGAGKTTTMRSVMGLTPAREGTIRFDGHDITRKKPDEISRLGIGFVPEERRLFPELTVRENIETVRDRDSDWTIDRVFEFFPKLEERAKNNGNQLSGGEQQMLAIARALVPDPQLFLLDEPSEGLAPIIVQNLHDMIQEVVETGITVLLTEQNAKFALSLSEKTYLLDKGIIQWSGATEDLKQNDELLDRYLSVMSAEV